MCKKQLIRRYLAIVSALLAVLTIVASQFIPPFAGSLALPFSSGTALAQTTTIPMVAAGGAHTVGLKSDGTVVAVGDNEYGQSNVGNWTGITQVAAGYYQTLGLKSDGTVVAVGLNNYGQCNVGSWTGITQVAAGAFYTVGLKSDGTVLAVGRNDVGQCNVSSWTGITQVAAQAFQTVGLKSNATVLAVGDNYYGQCNVGSWTGITQVASGYFQTLGLKSDGTVVAVGSNGYGQCNVGSWTGITQVAAGYGLTVGLKSGGSVVAVGRNDVGQCNVSSWTGITQVAAGPYWTVGLKSNGTVVAAGENQYGQCNVTDWNLGGATIPTPYNLQVPSFCQGDSRWGSDTMGTDDCTLSDFGCAVTCTAMVLNYYGVSAFDTTYNDYFLNDTNPKDLNQWLKQHSGYSGNGIVWANVEAYSNADEKGIDFVESEIIDWPEGTNIAGLSLVRDEIVAGHPVIVQVKTLWNGSLTDHWVVVKGIDSGTYYINDPAWPSSRTTLSSYDNTIYEMRVYHGTVPPQSTLVGSNVGVTLPGATLTFNTVTSSGNSAVLTSAENPAGGIPSGMGVVGSPFLDITTTAVYTGPITVGLYYDASHIINEGILKLFHWNGNLWEDITTLADTVNDVVFGQVSSLSWFAIMQPITSVSGVTMEVNGNILPGVTITLDGNSTALSDQDGQFEINATATGDFTVTAHKDGFRDRTQTVNITGLGEAYAVTCNFQGNQGLIPNAPNMQYALSCINHWLYPPNPETGLTMQTALAVINAWLYPVQ